MTDKTDFPRWPPPQGISTADCDVVGYGPSRSPSSDTALRLLCTIDGWEPAVHDVEVLSVSDEILAALLEIADEPAVTLELLAGSGFSVGWLVSQFALRSRDGELLLFSHDAGLMPSIQVDASPLTEVDAFDAGCDGRPPVHGDATVEQPWALDFATDDGVVRLFDRETATITVAEQAYEVIVAGAYRELEGCGKGRKETCEERAEFTVFRSAR